MDASIQGNDRVISGGQEIFRTPVQPPDWLALRIRQKGLEGTGDIRLLDLARKNFRMSTGYFGTSGIGGQADVTLVRRVSVRMENAVVRLVSGMALGAVATSAYWFST